MKHFIKRIHTAELSLHHLNLTAALWTTVKQNYLSNVAIYCRLEAPTYRVKIFHLDFRVTLIFSDSKTLKHLLLWRLHKSIHHHLPLNCVRTKQHMQYNRPIVISLCDCLSTRVPVSPWCCHGFPARKSHGPTVAITSQTQPMYPRASMCSWMREGIRRPRKLEAICVFLSVVLH